MAGWLRRIAAVLFYATIRRIAVSLSIHRHSLLVHIESSFAAYFTEQQAFLLDFFKLFTRYMKFVNLI